MGGVLLKAWHHVEEGVIALLLAFMTIVTFAEVVLRYVFNSSLLWAQEATSYAFGWLVLFGIAYGFRTHVHLGIDAAVKRLPVPQRRIVGLIAIACCAVFAGLMIYGSIVYVDKLYVVGIEAEDVPLERWILDAIIPFGFFLVLCRLSTEAWLILSGRANGFEIANEAVEVVEQLGTPGGKLDEPAEQNAP